jgi:hypothetical protein
MFSGFMSVKVEIILLINHFFYLFNNPDCQFQIHKTAF